MLSHDELLAKIATMEETYTRGETLVLGSALAYNALRVVVELHKPVVNLEFPYQSKCNECNEFIYYPCPTIEAITEELK